MSQPAIRIDGVSKQYWLGTGFHGNLSQAIEAKVRAPARKLTRRPARDEVPEDKPFWALHDVSFDIEPGTVMGLIGANGAGKSTLLKILARITAPTTGRIELHGRIGSLLEVGTGFHPELTGRENVFLNGAVLGMRRKEIAQRYNEIVEFSGIERFIETPVKRYSSGMYVRLAFAVAVHLDTEILLLDEVLAVGDAEFQRKCLDKVDATAAEGKTVVFVSHGLPNVQRLCDRCAWIEDGRVAAIGPTGKVASEYFKNVTEMPGTGEATIDDEVPRSVGIEGARIRRVAMVDESGSLISNVHLGQRFSVQVTIEVTKAIPSGAVEVGFNTVDGSRVVTVQNIDAEGPAFSLEPGIHEVQADIDVTLLPGNFTVDVGIHSMAGASYEYLQRVLVFTALNAALVGDDRYPWPTVRGSVRGGSEWSVVRGSKAGTAATPAP